MGLIRGRVSLLACTAVGSVTSGGLFKSALRERFHRQRWKWKRILKVATENASTIFERGRNSVTSASPPPRL